MSSMEGRWILVDVIPNNELSLLAVGNVHHGGAKFGRRQLSRPARLLLFEPFKAALRAGPADFSGAVRLDGQDWDVITKAIRSPSSGQIVAFRGIYTHRGTAIPEPQVVGAWEWEIESRENPVPTRIHWDDWMDVIYEIDPALKRRRQSDPGQWANELVVSSYRGKLTKMAADWIRESNFERNLVVYDIVTRYGTNDPGQKKLQMSSRLFSEGGNQDEKLSYKGITYEFAGQPFVSEPAIETILPEDVARVSFELSTDRVLFCCDADQQRAFMKSPSWADFGLPRDDDSGLDELVHPDDLLTLETYLSRVRMNTAPKKGVTVRFRTLWDRWRRFNVTAGTLNPARNGGRYLLCRLSPL
ncbi:hypothetical protein ABH924_003776 [Arthrobacter sp. GAS37]|uniref:hypothetical protein n=1 Tax=Arthrobacter sp. GAS37 TaxID=3156261 RepID=UPI003834D65E